MYIHTYIHTYIRIYIHTYIYLVARRTGFTGVLVYEALSY